MNEAQEQRLKRLIMRFKEMAEAEGYATSTLECYMGWLKKFAVYLRTTDIEEVGQITVDSMRKYQLYLYHHRNSKGVGYRLGTQAGILIAVKSFFRYLVRQRYLLHDPASAIVLPRRVYGLPKAIMTTKEIFKVLRQPDIDTPRGIRDKAILELLYSTGIRNSELRNLKVYDADLEHGELRITRGKGKKDRIVPLGEIAAKYVEHYIEAARPQFVERRRLFCLGRAHGNLRRLEQENDILFFGWRGSKLAMYTLGKIIKRYKNKAHLAKNITPHSFRHTCATHLLRGKASLRHIQGILGHSSLESTQRYTRVEVTDLKKEHHRCHPREQAR